MVLRGLLPYLFLLFICLTCLWNMAGVESAPTFSVSSSYALIGQRLSPRAKSKGSEMKTATPARKPVFSPRESEQVCWKKYSLSRQGCSKDADRIAPDAEGIISLRGKCIEKLFKIFSKVLCGILPARFRRFYRKIALLFSSKNDKNLRGSLSQMF